MKPKDKNVEDRIIEILKEKRLDILESIEVLRNIESAFFEHLKQNLYELEKKNLEELK